jgi:hypothetical protein
MASTLNASGGGCLYHVMNRGNCRMDVFQKPGDFAAFATILEEGRHRVRMRILAHCLMSDHWHITGREKGTGAESLGRVPRGLRAALVRPWLPWPPRRPEGVAQAQLSGRLPLP